MIVAKMKIGRLFKVSVISVISLAAGAFVFIIASTLILSFEDASKRGRSLSDSLLQEVAGAKQIRIVEHSCRWDYNPPSDEKSAEKIYSTVILNAVQVEQLRAVLSPSADYSATHFMACIFEPHHRVEFLRADGSVFKIELCFECGELDVNGGGQRIFPEGWQAKWESFIASLSLRPHAEWRELVLPANHLNK